MTIRNVSIGDQFYKDGKIKCEVVDFAELKSLTTNSVISTHVYAKCIDPKYTLMDKSFETTFATVIRYKLNNSNL